MQWDLGVGGAAVLAGMSLAVGIVAWLLLRHRTARWVPALVPAAFFVLGLFISEVWFGWATEEELQPNIDGLSFDEVLLGAFLVVVVLAVLRVRLGRRSSRPVVVGERDGGRHEQSSSHEQSRGMSMREGRRDDR